MRAVHRMREPRRARQAGDAGAATQPKHRQPFDRGRQPDPVDQSGVEARHRKPGHCVGHDHVDGAWVDTGRYRRLTRERLKQPERMLLERGGAVFPAMRLQIPFDRLAIVARLDAGVVEQPPHLFQMRIEFLGAGGRIRLGQPMRRIGRRQ